MSQKPDIELLYDEIARFIAESRELLERGAMAELAGLDLRVRELCDRALALPQQERERYALRLQELLDELNRLSEDMQRQKGLLAEEIRYASTHRKASVAYMTTSVNGQKKDEDEQNG